MMEKEIDATTTTTTTTTAMTANMTVSSMAETTTTTTTTNSTVLLENDRAVHRICLEALCHNYKCVDMAAGQQRCSVITVVKADGYGHGAIETALHLADTCGANAFAVATLEEGIALRQAFYQFPPGMHPNHIHLHNNNNHNNHLNNHHHHHNTTTIPKTIFQPIPPTTTSSSSGTTGYSSNSSCVSSNGSLCSLKQQQQPQQQEMMLRRPNSIRILVLGSPVGYPRCFDLYHHFQIECMVSGPEVAQSLLDWIADGTERKRMEVETVTMDWKQQTQILPTATTTLTTATTAAATLSNVSGMELAKEVRAILQKQQPEPTTNTEVDTTTTMTTTATTTTTTGTQSIPQLFCGIHDAVKDSRSRQLLATSKAVPPVRKRLRWHTLVDSGMGRLGFKSVNDNNNNNNNNENSKEEEHLNRDVVSIMKKLYDAEMKGDAPIEFFGMCTHMAEANSSSTYTIDQMERFKGLLKRVRQAGIHIPTISTDNSAALLTTNLTHFDPAELLREPHEYTDTRGFVRTGGAIYGQRPSFPQLKAISTLIASVRHVATVKKGESVGYDRAYIAERDVRIATLAIGFADGYPRELGKNVGKVSIHGQVFPVVGNVCMDMLMVEIGPEQNNFHIKVGDVAILWGPDDNHLVDDNNNNNNGQVRLQDFGEILKTTQSALTCGLNKSRVRREYV